MKNKTVITVVLMAILVLFPSNEQVSGQPILDGENIGQDGPPYYVYLPLIFKSCETCSTAPTLLAPANGSTLDTLLPLFRWDAGNNPNATNVRIMIDEDADFAHYALWINAGPTGIGEFRCPYNLDPATTYYWRAWLICSECQGPYTETWSFTTGSGGTILPAPNLVAPANGSTLPSLPTVLQWSAVSGADEYRVYWRELGSGGYTYTIVTVTQYSNYYLETSLTYEWWVAAINHYAVGADSVKWQFTTPAQAGPVLQNDLNPNILVEEDGNTRINIDLR
jgi:hypothetical protein